MVVRLPPAVGASRQASRLAGTEGGSLPTRIKLIESENYQIVDDGIIISDEEGIVLTLKEILKGKNENYKVRMN